MSVQRHTNVISVSRDQLEGSPQDPTLLIVGMFDSSANPVSMPPGGASPRWACLINRRSGGQAGAQLCAWLQTHPQVDAVVDIHTTGPQQFVAEHGPAGRLLVACGGDGTVSAVFGSAVASGYRCGVLPLALAQATPCLVDQWRLVGVSSHSLVDVRWFNYCSIGVDARIAQRFHVFILLKNR